MGELGKYREGVWSRENAVWGKQKRNVQVSKHCALFNRNAGDIYTVFPRTNKCSGAYVKFQV